MPALITPEKTQSASLPVAAKSKHSFVHLLIESVVAVVCVIVLLEALFTMAGAGEQEYLRVDKTLGFVPMENRHVTWRKEGFARIYFNSEGRNDIERPRAKPANTYRIAVVGDSFIESLQVDRNDNFCSLLQKSLNEKYGEGGKKHFEVLNFGCSANSLGQIYKKMQTQVFAYNPDLVIADFSVDATKLLAPLQGSFALANARPTYLLDKKGNLVEDWQVFNWWNRTPDGKRFARTEFLRRYSHIWGVIGNMMGGYSSWVEDLKAGKVWGWGQAAQAPAPTPPPALTAKAKVNPVAGTYNAFNSSCGGSSGAINGDHVSTTAAPVMEKSKSATSKIALPQAQGDVAAATKLYWPVADKLIRAMDQACVEHHCRFAILHLPCRPEIGYDNPDETERLQNLTRQLKIPYCDLSPAFLTAPKQVSLIYSVHMTEAGHKLAHGVILNWLEKNKLAFK